MSDSASDSTRDPHAALRQELAELLRGEHAHVGFEAAVRDVPPGLRGATPDGVEHSLWQLLVLQGAVGETARADVLAYAAPTYYGMLVAEVEVQTAA